MNNPGEIPARRFLFEEFGCNHENLDKGPLRYLSKQ